MYSRRYPIEVDQEEFQKTSLNKVKEADVASLRNIVFEAAGIDVNLVKNFIVHGEFICKGFYDYRTRGIMGDWKVFGAIIEMKEEESEISRKLIEAGFAIPSFSKNAAKKRQVKIGPNRKFFEIAKAVEIDVPDVKAIEDSIAEVIEKQKDDMKRGFILTVYNEELGYKVLEWKGCQEFHPSTHQNFFEANEKIQKGDSHDAVKKAFNDLNEVVKDISENEPALKMFKKMQPNAKSEKNEGQKSGRYLRPMDKDIILQGIFHSQKKFDSVEVYLGRGKDVFEEYTFALVEEVRKHLAEENERFEKADKDAYHIIAFINLKVRSVLKTQQGGLNVGLDYPPQDELTGTWTQEILEDY